MPFDFDATPQTDEEITRPEIYSLDGLIAYMERWPLEKYPYLRDCGPCLIERYFFDCGLPVEEVTISTYKLHGQAAKRLPAGFYEVVTPQPWTIEAALRRARALRGE